MEKEISARKSKGRLAIIFAFILLGCSLVFEVLSSFVFKDDATLSLLFRISSIAALILCVLSLVGVFLSYRKYKKETEEAAKEIGEQLDSYEEGKIKLVNRSFENSRLSEIQNRINELVVSRHEKAHKESNKAEAFKAGELMDEETFSRAYKWSIEQGGNYKSAMLALRIDGHGRIPEEAFSSLLEYIRDRFPTAFVHRVADDIFLAFLPEADSLYALEKALTLLVSNFAYLQVDKETDSSHVFTIKAAASIYPFVEAERLIGAAIRSLDAKEAVSVNVGNGQVYLPNAISKAEQKRAVLLSANQVFKKRLFDSTSQIETKVVIEDAIQYYAKILGFDLGGILTYNLLSKDYSVYVEKSLIPNGLGFVEMSDCGILSSEDIDPIFDFLFKEGISFVQDATLLPKEASELCQSNGAKSILLIPIIQEKQKFGLAYFTSRKKTYVDLLMREKADAYASLVSSAIIEIVNGASLYQVDHILQTVLKKGGKHMYSIDGEHRIVATDSELSKKIEGATWGATCYKAIRGLDAPCQDCPLKKGSVKALIPSLGNTEMTMSLIPAKRGSNIYSTILIEKENASLGSSNHLIDKKLFIHNAKAFTQDIAKEIHSRHSGYVFSLKVNNASSASFDNVDGLMRAIVSLIEDLGYSDICYRHGKDSLSFVLKNSTKPLSIVFAEEIAEALEAPLAFEERSLLPSMSYSLIGYPNEASTEFELDSLINTELDRSSSLGEGVIAEIGKTTARKAKRSEYILQAIHDALRRNQVQISTSPVIATATDKLFAVHCSAAIAGYSRERLSKRDFLPIATKAGIITELEFASLSRIKTFYKTYADNALKIAECQKIIWQISTTTLKDPETRGQIEAFLKETKLDKSNFVISLGAREVSYNEKDVEKGIADLKPLGIKFLTTSFDANIDKAETLKHLGFDFIRTTGPMIEDAMASDFGNNLFIRSVGSFSNYGISGIINGVKKPEQIQFCRDLSLPYYVDESIGPNPTEQELVSFLNYR